MHTAYFSRQAEKSFKKIPRDYLLKIKKTLLLLEKDQYSFGTIKLINYPAAKYRKRVEDYRVLFDIDDDRKILIIADIRRRTSTTYQ